MVEQLNFTTCSSRTNLTKTMKILYKLSIDITDDSVDKSLDILVETWEKAVMEVMYWAEYYRVKWNVPFESNETWSIEFKEIEKYYYKYNFHGPKKKLFWGRIHSYTLLEDNEEIEYIEGTVFKLDEPTYLLQKHAASYQRRRQNLAP